MLEINPSLVILTAIIFLILIAVLNSLLYKPMLKFLDDRNTFIKDKEDSVNKNNSDLGVYEQEIQSIISNARNEANAIKQEALNSSKTLAQAEIKQKKLHLEEEYLKFTEELNSKKDALKNELMLKVPELKEILNNKIARI
ncbi:ATP synthase, F0 complex, b' subunit [Campylobacter pinnipediorum subsp. caledonicus]|uniref:ATP synthase, F0 complex, b' subunit n=1 Tax=Campylobacter pinnipediorum subsp. caledonicus TaxID=1874362 RepID=A0A1S6U8N3_9BACT|nr:FoF1 ATP synthase subunit B' [Campylobacter pinnipediorum]AQW86408.1 ATP synthase, F0 complex, b' subunit [Campylobacter pinnipediorum subsp. caledonicus]AQW88060.1 ATP synthase, F0 complex, b' subunit [Campylobacter pinnipediorum subsp. caledonicus]OPA71505.1 F0F1 ATP synthase subunit B' [Campylobacter pinnipediorum subsp. caledonicus]